MGSGETAPPMIKPHRRIFDAVNDGGPVDAVMLDTPFGFQENHGELTEKTLQYFDQSIGRPMAAAGLRRSDDGDTVAIEQALARIRSADLVFAGPGSPTFALRQWAPTSVPDVLRSRLREGGAVVFSSAAALTLGRRTVPVYEIYKVGAEPVWLEGMDVLGEIGLPVAVIPHYDNNEGQTHDTRFCYLGETRLAMLEAQLSDDEFVLGVDEHTGVLLDLDADTAEVFGKGGLTIRRLGVSRVIPAGETVAIDVLRRGDVGGLEPDPAVGTGADPASTAAGAPDGATAGDRADAASLDADVARAEAAFDAAITARDADAAVAAVLACEQAIVDWSADTNQSDADDRARAALRAMIVRLGAAATDGLVDPRETLDPVVTAILNLRGVVRAEKRYDLSDVIRDELAAASIEVRDTPDGVEWVLL